MLGNRYLIGPAVCKALLFLWLDRSFLKWQVGHQCSNYLWLAMIFHTKKVQYTMQSSRTWYALLLCRIEGLLIKFNDSPSQSVSVWKFPAKFTFHKLTQSILMKIALEKQKVLSSFYAMCSDFKYWHIYLQKHQNVHLTCLLTSPTCLFPKPSTDIKWIVIGLLNSRPCHVLLHVGSVENVWREAKKMKYISRPYACRFILYL